MQNKIRINKEGCTFSAYFITSDILSIKMFNYSLANLSISPLQIIKQILLKLFIFFLFSVDSFEKNDVPIFTLFIYSDKIPLLFWSNYIIKFIILPIYFIVCLLQEKKPSELKILKIYFLNSFTKP